jgi:hypothetical protein
MKVSVDSIVLIFLENLQKHIQIIKIDDLNHILLSELALILHYCLVISFNSCLGKVNAEK